MKEKKLQVFVSSTFIDLIEERQAAVGAILSSGNIPAGMELFSAGDESQMNVIKRWIDESDVYMLILGGRYGSVEQISGKSYTQLEYEYAIEKNKALFAVVLSDEFIDKKVSQNGKSALELDNNKQLKAFRELVTSKMVEFCNDDKDIQLAVFKTLSEFGHSKELIGWIRGDNAVNSSLLADEMARLAKENDELRKSTSSNQENLYNGLKYTELEEILSEDKIHYHGKEINLCQFLLKKGPEITQIVNAGIDKNRPYELLSYYKILKETFKYPNFEYTFTSDGHNFYLKLLYNTYKKDKE